MPPIRQVGISPHELEELVDEDRWRQWCAAEPILREVSGLAELRCLRGEAEDRLLGALLRLAAHDGGDDQLAAITVVHQLGGAVRLLARRYWHLSDGDIEGLVVGSMWEQIRSFDCQRHTRHYGAVLVHATRRAVRAVLMPGRGGQSGGVVLLDPQSWLFEALLDHPESGTASQLSAHDELRRFLDWAVGTGWVAQDDAGLLMTLVLADRANPDRVKWLRGACSMAAVARVADERGVCAKSVTRARDRVLERLREAVPAYLEEVA